MPRTVSENVVFSAIASPTRRALLHVLANGERTGSDLIASLQELSMPA